MVIVGVSLLDLFLEESLLGAHRVTAVDVLHWTGGHRGDLPVRLLVVPQQIYLGCFFVSVQPLSGFVVLGCHSRLDIDLVKLFVALPSLADGFATQLLLRLFLFCTVFFT